MLLKTETKITNLTFPHLLTVVSHVHTPFCPHNRESGPSTLLISVLLSDPDNCMYYCNREPRIVFIFN